MLHRLWILAWFIALFSPFAAPALPQTGSSLPVVHLPGERPGGLGGPQGRARLPAWAAEWVNGEEGALVGLFAPGAFAHPVVTQPTGRNLYVSTDPEVLTRFQLPSRTATIGLLAHNYLAGAHFFLLQPGDALFLVYGDGRTAAYRVSELADYRTINLYRYRDLETDLSYSDLSLYEKIYMADGDRLVLQTCIERDGNLSWGLRFVIASRVADSPPPASRSINLPPSFFQ
jgi:hypothetical protein